MISTKPFTQYESECRVERPSADRKNDRPTGAWPEPQAAENPQAEIDAEGEHYEQTGGQLLLGERVSITWFGADDVPDHLSERRCQLHERIWRVDRGLDIDPSDSSLGTEVGHYADSTVDTEIVSNFSRFKNHLADTCLQQLEVPEFVRNHVLYLIHNRDLVGFNRYGGVDGAIVGLTMEALADFHDLDTVADLKETSWWSDIESLADEFGIVGATGRTFRQLIAHVEDEYDHNQ
ncbi:hypothetical protein EXE46_15550 [Halorubrum sp. GN11_10-6_MGM]|uniref:hypothetical protein n=1 Tax=Halorubrum sp. GN11_10-6_MGM TaxID=2518112 RepID=UPI0010F5989C|nr:hypothetical protein [Halorubrum sp. GN11_10-6_MGM]TKX72628.1 hypothetical protein EXE46_15550 [Halorubrum sp. GN11_10-6_MGM]